MKKKIKIAKKMFIALIIYWVSYNTYFGWNFHPESELEKIFDFVYSVGFAIAVLQYLSPLRLIYMMVVNVLDDKLNEIDVDININKKQK